MFYKRDGPRTHRYHHVARPRYGPDFLNSILFGTDVFEIAGAEGGLRLLLTGAEGSVHQAVELVESIQGEPALI